MKLTPGVVPMLLATSFFALMNVGVKALAGIPAHEVVLFRSLITLLVTLPMLRRAGVSPRGVHRPLLIARGLAGTLALLMYFWTLQQMPLATAVTVQHLSPVFTILISALLLREPPRWLQLPCFALAFAGVVLVKGFDPAVTAVEVTVGISAALFAGLAYNLVRLLRKTDHPLVVVFYFPLVTVPVVAPYTALHWVTPQGWQWAALLGVGLTTTGGQIFLTRAYQADRAANISILNYVGIVLALLLGLGLFGEQPRPLALLGVCLIGAGVALGTRFARSPA